MKKKPINHELKVYFVYKHTENKFIVQDIVYGFGKHSKELVKLYTDPKTYAIDIDQVSIDQVMKVISSTNVKEVDNFEMTGRKNSICHNKRCSA